MWFAEKHRLQAKPTGITFYSSPISTVIIAYFIIFANTIMFIIIIIYSIFVHYIEHYESQETHITP